MGICESAHHGKSLSTEICQNQKLEIEQNDHQNLEVDPNEQTMDYNNMNKEESTVHPSLFNQTETRNSITEEIKTNEKPELAKYDRSLLCSGKRSEFSHNNNTMNKNSLFSSGVSEEEIIIKGEINKEAKNKEEDFINNSFKNEVKNKGGIIIKNNDISNSIYESGIKSSIFENISEIHSIQNSQIQNNGVNIANSLKNNASVGISSIKIENNNNHKNYNNIGNNNKVIGGIISGKYDINGNLIPNNNIKYNNRYRYNNSNNNIIGINSIIRESSKINISLHESCPKFESFLNVPKTDQPPPDLDEISENMLSNSPNI